MPILNDKEYQCDLCRKTYDLVRDETWDEEKAKKEFKKTFPNADWETRKVICDNCWKLIRPQ